MMVWRKSNYEPLSFEMTELPESNFVREFQPYDIDHRRHEGSRGVGIGLLRRRARTMRGARRSAERSGCPDAIAATRRCYHPITAAETKTGS